MKKKCFLLWTNTKLEKWINVSSLGCRSWTNYFQLQYASPSWSGFLSAADCSRLQAILNKAVRYGFLPKHSPSINKLFQSADQSLFQSIIHNSHHVLHQLLPPIKNSGYSLRSQSHQYTLPTISTSNAKKVLWTECYTLTFTDSSVSSWPFILHLSLCLWLSIYIWI